MTPCSRRTHRPAGLLLLCAVQAAIFILAAQSVQASPLQHDLVTLKNNNEAIGAELSVAAQTTNSRRLLNRLLLQQQQDGQQQGQGKQQQLDQLLSQVDQLKSSSSSSSSTDLKPLYEMARAASGPDQVVILDDSPAARSLRRGRPTAQQVAEDEEIIIEPVDVTPPGQQAPTDVPTRPITPQPDAPSQQVQKGPYCIPRGLNGLAVLAAGDSITQGAVPSKNFNHPYTINMEKLLEANLMTEVRAVDAGLGGGGIFMPGFNVPVTFGPWLDTYMDQGPWSVVLIMIGINDLLRGGKPAQDIMNGLAPMIEKVVAKNTPVILMPPFAAPGFVQESDSKESERKKLVQLLRSYSQQQTARTGGVGPQVWMLDLQASPFDFYTMPPSERSKWLDDGLHMTEEAYDTIGQLVAQEIARKTCPGPPTATNSN